MKVTRTPRTTSRLHWLPLATLLLCGTVRADEVLAPKGGPDAPAKQGAAAKKPQVEVVFVLDTTGSMGGLLEGAKKKIWTIATEILRGEPRPEVKIGLVAYRDRGDSYLTQVTPLTDDLDAVHKQLSLLSAGGGGDTPEDVRSGLHHALTKIQWTQDKDALKLVFLVGDAPAHEDYQDVPTLKELAQLACRSNVIVNTIRCGGDADAGRQFQELARLAEGRFASIEQNGGVVAVATPFDEELGKLNDKLGRTFVAYGGKGARLDAERREAAGCGPASGLAADDKAARACAKAAAPSLAKDDLVDAARDGRVSVGAIKEEELPDELKKLSEPERKAFLEKKAQERDAIRNEIAALAKKRDDFIAGELAKRGVKDGFDEVVRGIVREQADAKLKK